ncbi:MAG: tRNA lysidine(34) synthetase TilS [Thermoleophilia bacterium]
MDPPPAHSSSDIDPQALGDAASLPLRVRGLCSRENLFSRTEAAVVMVSGGQDSLALLHLLATGALGAHGPRSVRVLHVNHHLRGDESHADQSLVETHCGDLGVPLSVIDARVRKDGGNVQAEARRLRQAAALETLGEAGLSVAAVAHTLDDQVETLLYRLGRYGGLRALAGMSPKDPPWVRPLLAVRRVETEAYCRAHGLRYAVDRGNAHPGYARTGLRQRVVPAWEKVLPGAVAAAGRAAEVAAEAYLVLREAVDAALIDVSPVGVPAGGSPRELSIARLSCLSPALRRAVLHAVLEECVGQRAARALVLDVEGLLAGAGHAAVALGGGWTAERAYGRLLVRSPAELGNSELDPDSGSSVPASLPCPGEAVWGGVVICAEPVPFYRAHDPLIETYLDGAAVTRGLWVRGVLPGDRMRPLGAPGSRLLQDVLVDGKVPRRLRARVPVVGSGDTILWLAGYAVAEEGRIGPTTHRLVRVSVHERDSGPGSRHPEGGVHHT